MNIFLGMDPLTAVRSSTASVVEQAQHVSISDLGKVPVKALFLDVMSARMSPKMARDTGIYYRHKPFHLPGSHQIGRNLKCFKAVYHDTTFVSSSS
jgi:hypothetical protein